MPRIVLLWMFFIVNLLQFVSGNAPTQILDVEMLAQTLRITKPNQI